MNEIDQKPQSESPRVAIAVEADEERTVDFLRKLIRDARAWREGQRKKKNREAA